MDTSTRTRDGSPPGAIRSISDRLGCLAASTRRAGAPALAGGIHSIAVKHDALATAHTVGPVPVCAVVGRVVVVDLVALQREVELGHVEVDEEAWLGSG